MWQHNNVAIDEAHVRHPVIALTSGGLSEHGFVIDLSNQQQVQAAIKRRQLWFEWMEQADHGLIWHTYTAEFYRHFFLFQR